MKPETLLHIINTFPLIKYDLMILTEFFYIYVDFMFVVANKACFYYPLATALEGI